MTLRSYRNQHTGGSVYPSAIVTDRVRSVVSAGPYQNRSYYPYGEEKGTPTANGADKFATCYRDEHTEFDYAMQRYYHSGSGRFLTPDPYRASGGPADPGSWNRYAYVQGDPVNFNDPSGALAAGVSFGEGSAGGCVPGPFGAPGGAVDASSSCPPGYIWVQGTYGGSMSRTRQVWQIFEPLGGIIDDWDYANQYGTAFDITLPANLYNYMVDAGTIAIGAEGATIGGILIRITVTGATLASSPVTLTVVGLAGTAILAYEIYRAARNFPTIEKLKADCTPGRLVTEPASASRYRGGTSFEQEYLCPNGTFTVHWIEKNGQVVHGPHVRPGPAKGGAGG